MNPRLLKIVTVVVFLVGCSTTKNIEDELATKVPIYSQINLTKVENDKVPVTINPGRFTTQSSARNVCCK